jgi:uncharacterized protein YjbI with pentapeptide repeats
VVADLTGASLVRLNTSGANLAADMKIVHGADPAVLKSARLDNADLRNADLSRAELQFASLKSDLTGVARG